MQRKKTAAEPTVCSQPNLAVRFPDYLDGQLSSDEAKQIEQHLAVCATCRRKLRLWLSLREEGLPSTQAQARTR